MKNFGHYGCLTKRNCQLKSSAMARNTFNIPFVGVSDASFRNTSAFFKENV